MDWTQIVSTLGFPIACAIALAFFVYKLYQDSKERENKFFVEIAENRKVNAKFAEIIAKYETQLEEIKSDVKEIKDDINIIMNQNR